MRNVSHLSLDVIHFPFDLLVKILCALGWLLLQPYCIYGLIHEAVAQSPVCRHTCMIARMDTHSTSTAFTVRARWALCSDASQVIAVSVSTEGGDFWWCESFLFFSCSLARNADGNSMLGVPLSCWAFWLKFQMCDLSLSSPSVPASIRAVPSLPPPAPPEMALVVRLSSLGGEGQLRESADQQVVGDKHV